MRRLLLATVAVLPVAAAPAFAQGTSQNAATQNQQAQAGSQDAVSASDFVRQAANINTFEIDAAQLTFQHSGRKSIKNFARTLIDDHQSAQKLLKRRASEDLPDHLGQAMQQKLTQLRQAGAGFDAMFLRMQVDGHEKAIDLYKSYAQNGDTPGLKRYAKSVLPDLQDHLAEAQQLQQRINRARSDQSAMNTTNGMDDQSTNGRPVINVQQRRAQVEVQQHQPRITIQQPAPKITIEQAQPHVTVWLPEPDVNVNQPKPQVSYNAAQPQVDVQQGANHAVTYDQPQTQPQVDFHQTGTPQVTYRRAAGQPTVEYKSAQDEQSQTGTRSAQAMQGANQGQQANNQTGQQPNAAARQRSAANAQQNDTTGTVARTSPTPASAANSQDMRRMSVGDIVDMDIYNARGNDLGNIEQVVVDRQTKKTFLVLAAGGFLGMFQDRVAIPMQRVHLRNGRLVASGLTQEDVEGMQNWKARLPNRRVLDDSEWAEVPQAS